MKILNVKYIFISFIIIIAILYFTFMDTKSTDEVSEKATLVYDSELGGIVGGKG